MTWRQALGLSVALSIADIGWALVIGPWGREEHLLTIRSVFVIWFVYFSLWAWPRP